MARTDAPTETTAPAAPKSAAERLDNAFGAFKAADGPVASPYDAQRKSLINDVRNVFVDQLTSLQTILGDKFASAGDQDAAAKTAASLRRAQTTAIKAVKSISDETLAARAAAESEDDSAE